MRPGSKEDTERYYLKYLDRKARWEHLNAQALAETREIIRARVPRTDSDDAKDENNEYTLETPANGWNI